MSQIYNLLLDNRKIRERAVVIVVSLMQQRPGFMQDLLVTEIQTADNKMEPVDLLNRGPFGALMVAHDLANIADNAGSTNSNVRRDVGMGGMNRDGKCKYQSFFEWFEKNQMQVAAVFHGIHIQASRLLPELNGGAITPEAAIESEQKVMLLKLTSQDSSDRTIQGGIKRAELTESLQDKTHNNHSIWKREGFNDLSAGAMTWKKTLFDLKGSHSVWEGRRVLKVRRGMAPRKRETRIMAPRVREGWS